MDTNEPISKRKQHVGILIKCISTGNIFLLKRGGDPFKGAWGLLSGGLEEDENPMEGLKREIQEEIKINPNIIKYRLAWTETSSKSGTKFYYYVGIVENEFKATLDDENLASGWFSKENLPTPLYPNLELKIAAI